MIRMGRNPKLEAPQQQPEMLDSSDLNRTNQPFNFSSQTNETKTFQQSHDLLNQSTNRVYTENESMVRDIKEGRLSGFIGSGTTLNGDTNFKAMLRVDGHLTGRVSSESGTLFVGAGGQVDANIVVAAAVINGVINGDIAATERIELGRTAKIIGNIQTPLLTMEEGAVLEGNCSMIKVRSEAEKKAKQTLIDAPKIEKDFMSIADAEPVNNLQIENGAIAAIK